MKDALHNRQHRAQHGTHENDKFSTNKSNNSDKEAQGQLFGDDIFLDENLLAYKDAELRFSKEHRPSLVSGRLAPDSDIGANLGHRYAKVKATQRESRPVRKELGQAERQKSLPDAEGSSSRSWEQSRNEWPLSVLLVCSCTCALVGAVLWSGPRYTPVLDVCVYCAVYAMWVTLCLPWLVVHIDGKFLLLMAGAVLRLFAADLAVMCWGYFRGHRDLLQRGLRLKPAFESSMIWLSEAGYNLRYGVVLAAILSGLVRLVTYWISAWTGHTSPHTADTLSPSPFPSGPRKRRQFSSDIFQELSKILKKPRRRGSRSPDQHTWDRTRSPIQHTRDRTRSPIQHTWDRTRSPIQHTRGRTRSPPEHIVDRTRFPIQHSGNRTRSPIQHNVDRTRSPPEHIGDRTRSPPQHGGQRSRTPPEHMRDRTRTQVPHIGDRTRWGRGEGNHVGMK